MFQKPSHLCFFVFVHVICMVVSYTYCIVFFVLSSLCVWWCPIHIVLCFLFCPRYMYGGVLHILYCGFCFVLVMCMVVSYIYCIVFFPLSSLCVCHEDSWYRICAFRGAIRETASNVCDLPVGVFILVLRVWLFVSVPLLTYINTILLYTTFICTVLLFRLW